MRSGVCPKCGSTDVYSNEHLSAWVRSGYNWANTIPITGLAHAELGNFVCVNCGYTENYISNRNKLQKIAEKWPRLRSQLYEALGDRPTGRTKTCPGCQATLPEDWKACPYCGQPMM